MGSYFLANSPRDGDGGACFGQGNFRSRTRIPEKGGIIRQTTLNLNRELRAGHPRRQCTQNGNFVRLGERGPTEDEQCLKILLYAQLAVKARFVMKRLGVPSKDDGGPKVAFRLFDPGPACSFS